MQVVRRHILGSIIQSERSYLESLRRILQVSCSVPVLLLCHIQYLHHLAFMNYTEKKSGDIHQITKVSQHK